MFSASKSKGASGSYRIANSLRFRSSASAYLNRTPSSAGNRQTWTWSAWVKRGKLDSYLSPLGIGLAGGSNFYIRFEADNTLYINEVVSGVTNISLVTNQVFRDPSAWYHLMLVVDTTQATAANRVKLYLNGSQITAFSSTTYPSQNYNTLVNSTNLMWIGTGSNNATPNYYFDGYLADINFIDGQALTPSSFGQISTITGVWQPIAYSGTYGTNGFKLNFSNGTSTTTLGYDSSGNSNNWTTNNISLTAGSTYDWMIDSPTSFAGSSYGVGNYCVMNPLRYATSVSFAAGNIECTFTNNVPTAATIAIPSTGKWYFEGAPSAITYFSDVVQTGIGLIPQSVSSSDANAIGLTYGGNGKKINAGTGSSYGAAYIANDVIGVAVDMDAGTLTFYKNNSSQGTAFSGISTSTTWFASVCQRNSGSWYMNFGQRPFSYTPPTGYKSLCTYNLPAPSIVNGAAQFAATTYTGTGSSLSVSGAAFQPDLVWIKSRSAATDNKLTDVIRGTTNALVSNSTAAATTDAGGVTAFNSNGFTVGTTAAYNTNAATYIAWQWKANGTGVSNTAGSISSTVSANTTAGFSVVTYTGTGVNATVGHGLGVAPNMLIIKKRSSTADGWIVGHSNLTSWAYYLFLDTTNAQALNSTVFNSAAPTSSVFSVGTISNTNANTATYIAYCFAAIPGYSAFGSYTGNGATDGPFIFTGFRPRYVLIKNSSAAQGWSIMDTSRSTYNVVDTYLTSNDSLGDRSGYSKIDIVSNGFKIRETDTFINGSGNTMIFAAFAENPFQNALAR